MELLGGKEIGEIEQLYELLTRNEERAPPSVMEKKRLVSERLEQQIVALFEWCKRREGEHFMLSVQKSSLGEAAGEGVFIHGNAPAGTVVAIYKGTIYQTSDMMTLYAVHPELFTSNEYIATRADKMLIDGCPHGQSSQIFSMTSKRAASSKLTRGISTAENPFAVAQMLNHSKDPNCGCFSFDFSENFPSELVPWIPAVFFGSQRPPRMLSCTVVMVTLRDVSNEELFFDYKFDPRGERVPRWYTDSLRSP